MERKVVGEEERVQRGQGGLLDGKGKVYHTIKKMDAEQLLYKTPGNNGHLQV